MGIIIVHERKREKSVKGKQSLMKINRSARPQSKLETLQINTQTIRINKFNLTLQKGPSILQNVPGEEKRKGDDFATKSDFSCNWSCKLSRDCYVAVHETTQLLLPR